MHLENTTTHPIQLNLPSKTATDGTVTSGLSVVFAPAKGEGPSKVNGWAHILNPDGSPSGDQMEIDAKEIEFAKAHDKVVAAWFASGDLVEGKAKTTKATAHDDDKHAHKK